MTEPKQPRAMDSSFNHYAPTDGQEQTVVGTLSCLQLDNPLMVFSSVGCPCLPLIVLITTIRAKRYMIFDGRLSTLHPTNLQTSILLFITHLHPFNHNSLLIRSLTHGTGRQMLVEPGNWKVRVQLVTLAPGETLKGLVFKYPSMKLSNSATKDKRGCPILTHFSPPRDQLVLGPDPVMLLKPDRKFMLQYPCRQDGR